VRGDTAYSARLVEAVHLVRQLPTHMVLNNGAEGQPRVVHGNHWVLGGDRWPEQGLTLRRGHRRSRRHSVARFTATGATGLPNAKTALNEWKGTDECSAARLLT
jgi:hypothetical protein